MDGYKAHISIDPDSEPIVATDVTAGNVGDAVPAAGSIRVAHEFALLAAAVNLARLAALRANLTYAAA